MLMSRVSICTHTHTHILLQLLPCFQCNVCAARAGREARGVAVLSKRSEQTRMAKSNIITATIELVKEQKRETFQREKHLPLTIGVI